MPSTVEQLSPTRVKITVEVPFSDLKPNLDKAYRDIASQVNIPGFRRGKVPPMIIDQRFGRGVILSEALNEAIPDLYGRAVTENGLNPLAQPDVEVTKLEDGELVEFTAEVDVRPDFALPDFSALSATVDALDVPDSLVDEQLETLRERFGSLNPVDRPAADGDHATISLRASKDGEVLADAAADDLSYVVGSGQMLDGLDEALVGLSAGESATFTSTLVGGPMKGEEADIEVSLAKVQEQDLPALDDEFAQTASEFDSLDELKADLRNRLTSMARLEQASAARDAVLENLIGQVDLVIPENVLATEVAARKEQIESQLAQAQLSLDEYLAETEDASGADAFWADVEQRAADALKAQLVLDKIADEREIGVDQTDLTQHILRRAQNEGVNPQEIAEHMQEHPHHITEYMTEIRRGKALAQVVESATVTDSDGAPVELAGLRPDGTVASPEELEAERLLAVGRGTPPVELDDIDEADDTDDDTDDDDDQAGEILLGEVEPETTGGSAEVADSRA